ncbi:SpaA isopeptide-forming pilin-related protein [Collinsella aerofaciens]|uniref:Spy0128 family protein n=1 Tax=Collinsella aerofaciens TaxID=74426 RepID=UPI00189EB393|nr:FctA domain-containing protein [Collinsella aerofaciens]MDB1859780.1 SpaA isopeptide-forming pilin-related protein [Collinsella aerofaciens]
MKGSFALDGTKLEPQPKIDSQVATLDSLGDLSHGDHTITYETELKSGVSANNGEFIDGQEASKNMASWEWGGANDRQSGTVTAAPSKFRYDMISKSSGSGTSSDIKWTVKLNQGELKANMSGYVFTDKLDNKQTYKGSYAVYKGDSSSALYTGEIETSQDSFSFKFPADLADKYATYRIEYHTEMTDANSYETVRNEAKIEHEGRVSGNSGNTFTPQLVGNSFVVKSKEDSSTAAADGMVTWKLVVDLGSIVNAYNPNSVTVYDTFQSALSQTLGPVPESYSIKIGDKKLNKGQDWDFWYRYDTSSVGTKKNINLDIYTNSDRVKEALELSRYAEITYKTRTDALPGWYSNFAAVGVQGWKSSLTDVVTYVVNNEAPCPAVEKPTSKAVAKWDENFDWNTVDGSKEKGAWVISWTVYANRATTVGGGHYGATKLNGNPLNIVDTLPAGMSYVPGSAKYLLYQNPHTPPAANNYGRGDEVTMLPQGFPNGKDLVGDQVKSDASANAVTFSIPTTELGDYAGYAKLTYQTAVKRSELDISTNEVKFTNTASAESGSKKFESGSGTVTVKNSVIKKSGEQVANSNRIKYTILVNESAVALKNGTDFLELVDTMDAKCTLVPSTLKVYEWVDGAWSSLSDMDYSSSMERIDDASGSRTKLTLSVPDEKYLKVEYEVIPTGNPGDKVSLSNTATLTGVTEGTAIDDQIWTIQSASASTGGNGYGITVTKYDAQQVGATLKGAGFALYSVDMGGESARKLFATTETDDSGNISFGTSGSAMNSCVLYQLEETRAPVGYAKAKSAWIMLKGNENDEDYQAALAKAKTIVGGADIIGDDKKDEIWIYDNRLTGSAVIKAKKVLEGGTFKEGQFSFELKDGEGKVLQTVTNDAEGNVSFPVEYNKAGTYTYKISEVVPKDAEGNVKDHITYDTTEHKVKVVVANGDGKLDVTVTYDNDSPTPPTFTNRYSTTLPEAGGAGLTMTYLAGASMLCFAATWMHARRHRDLDRGGRRE